MADGAPLTSALVTGAASGIGRCLTRRLALRGVAVWATDRDLVGVQRVVGELGLEQVRAAELDVTDPEAWIRALDEAEARHGSLDGLFNVAGYLQAGWVHEVALADVDRHFDVNVKGVIYGTRLAAERMVRRRRGHIVNVASMASFAPVPGMSLYGATKFAVRAFSLAAAIELRPKGVAVTVVCPDAVDTPMLDKQVDTDEASITFSAPRVLTADEVAYTMAYPVLEDRPFEVALPRSRKWLARMLDMAPSLGPHVAPLFHRLGRSRRVRHPGGGRP